MDQVIQHQGNFKAIIEREVKDLKKMDAGRVTTKVYANEEVGYAKHDSVRGDAEPQIKIVPGGKDKVTGKPARNVVISYGGRQEVIVRSCDPSWTDADAKAYVEKHYASKMQSARGMARGDASPIARAKVKVDAGAAVEMTLVKNGNVYEVRIPGEVLFTDHDEAKARRVFETSKNKWRADADPAYNPEGVNQAIAAQNRSGRGKIGGREAKMIHSLLKGNEGYAARNPRKDGTFDFAYNADIKYAKEQLAAVKKAWPSRPDHPEIKALEKRIKMLQSEKRGRKDSEPATLDSVLGLADELYARSDAVARGEAIEGCSDRAP